MSSRTIGQHARQKYCSRCDTEAPYSNLCHECFVLSRVDPDVNTRRYRPGLTPHTQGKFQSARSAFLALRTLADMPEGGEIVLKDEVRQLCDALDLPTHGTRKEMIARLVGGTVGKGARDYGYLQSSEARMLIAVFQQKRAEQGLDPLPPEAAKHSTE